MILITSNVVLSNEAQWRIINVCVLSNVSNNEMIMKVMILILMILILSVNVININGVLILMA